MENIITNYVLDVDIIVKKLSFVCFLKVKQPSSVLKMLKSTVQTIAAGLLRENIFGMDEMSNLRKTIYGDTVAAE